MERPFYRTKRRTSMRRLWCRMPAWLCVTMMTGLVFAQSKPNNTPAQAKPKPNAKKGIAKPKIDRALKRTRSKRKGKKQLVMNSDAKWECENATISVEPTWRSNKAIECSFDIRNGGTAPLQIQARGG